ncbi:RNA-binding Ran Zn-finger protein and related proteins [Plasmopara halstedii]|uniref:RNA-binding Ran Zn-finger protein and related proteins n=1 Tax=Plasmopara halstedii TaxID=4781 RepID=A0A0P1A856_PLAHL|nr:RNA-binding Ran Zn-finger protein and related proteins [Plasmopara halstedii]CEG36847.1 RNA-binding Ran Zn-finger protein and related proteins [Plasmopara halstedii]|eukprot:XP_024573216.1 RNA-binding Ran Zn-finger protein and related proteins [Plasmopara halstedii]
MDSSQCIMLECKTVAGGKDLRVACITCTFLNSPDVLSCRMCGEEMRPLTHDVHADGSWKCGGCGTENAGASKECLQCHIPFYSLVTTAPPAQIFCSRCGFLNDGDNLTCVECDCTIRSTLDKISTNLRDSTNFLARDLGVNIHVKCPGCFLVCYVPPATACLRCGACHTYFASPSIGEVTNFYMNRLASSISSSFMSFFGRKRGGKDESEVTRRQEEAREAPVGRLIAAGQGVAQSSCYSSANNDASHSSTSTLQLYDNEMSNVEMEEKAEFCQIQARISDSTAHLEETMAKLDATTPEFLKCDVATSVHSDIPGYSEKREPYSPLNLSSPSKAQEQPMFARPMPLRVALPPAHRELVKVEGDIVEL